MNSLKNKIETMKLVRELYGISLAEAKFIVEYWMQAFNFSDPCEANFSDIMKLIKFTRNISNGDWIFDPSSETFIVVKPLCFSDIHQL